MNDDDFEKCHKRFNALLGDYSGFEATVARKEHKDLFGDSILRDDIYYKATNGLGGWDNVTKLSRESMEKVFECSIERSPLLVSIADKIIKTRWDEVVTALNKKE